MTDNTINPEKWVDKYSDYLFNYAVVRVNDRELAKDLISETFLSALRASKKFKGKASERTWLIAILKRKIIDYYRKSNSKKGKAEIKVDLNSKEGKWLEEMVSDPNDISAQKNMETQELRKRLFECLDELNERQATIFKMKTLDDIETEVICKEFNITPSNLWVIIHRARVALAHCLENYQQN